MEIISRSEWDAKHGRGDLNPGPEPRVVIHHSYRPALTIGATPEEERAAVRGIERYHVENNGWAGIGYGFLVAPSGRVYEGRGWEYKGAHAGPVNGSSIGVCLLIDGSVQSPGYILIEAVRELIRLGIERGEIEPDYTLTGHRDHMNRNCPGDLVYARLQEFRHDAAREPDAPSLSVPARPDGPATNDTLRLDRIEVPTREHVNEILRVRQFSPRGAVVGLVVAEVLLRGVVAAAGGDRKAGAKVVADALADWLKGG